LLTILVLHSALQGLEYKVAGFCIATSIEAASYQMILQVLCMQLSKKKFYVCKLIYLEKKAVKETFKNRAATKELYALFLFILYTKAESYD
jgi:hypothetical protein